MIELIGMGSPNVVKALIMLEELSLPYRFKMIDVFACEQHEPGFRRLNPNGKVPILVDPDGPKGKPITLSESGAILIYLADKSGQLLSTEGPSRYSALQWLMWQMSGLGPMGGQAIHFTVLHQDDTYARRRFTIELERLLEVLRSELTQSEYIAGDTYSIADIALFPWLRTLAKFFPSTLEHSTLARWYSAIGARPAVVKALEFADEIAKADMKNMRSASPESLDQYFGRTGSSAS